MSVDDNFEKLKDAFQKLDDTSPQQLRILAKNYIQSHLPELIDKNDKDFSELKGNLSSGMDHLKNYFSSETIDHFKEALNDLKNDKDQFTIPLNKDFPYQLLKKMVAYEAHLRVLKMEDLKDQAVPIENNQKSD